jgi:3-hydroxyacyl-CoA dehydrogenase
MTAQLGTVTVLGTGVLGSQIAYQSAYCGYSVTAYNIAAASADERMQAAAALLKERYIDRGKLGRESGEGFYTYPAAVSAG